MRASAKLRQLSRRKVNKIKWCKVYQSASSCRQKPAKAIKNQSALC